MKKSIAIVLFALLALGTAGTLQAAIVGDIDNDGTISLQEAIYALQVTAGNVTNVPDSCAITGTGAWTAGATYNLCDVVQDNGENYICTQAHLADVANRPPDNTNWEIISLTGQNGLNSAIAITTEPAGANCAAGGQKIEAGLDTDDDGTPDIALTAPAYVCNGATGADGADGAAGAAGANGTSGLNSAIAITPETGGANCATGGQKIEAGLDTDGNGTPDASLTTAYVCNGDTGSDGAAGAAGSDGLNSLVTLVQESYLNAVVCEFGGTIIEVGLDADRSDVLEEGEVTGSTTICNSEAPATATNSVGMTYNLIPGGTYTMGQSPDAVALGLDFADEAQHQVTISNSFYLMTTEVTQDQWEAVMGQGTNPSASNICGDCPVDSVSWDDTQVFIEAINLLGEGSYRLPTEAEWEYAARAGSTTAFYNGPITGFTSDPNLDVIGWYAGNTATTQPVMQKLANAWGLFDMHGNVREWVEDWYLADLTTIDGTDPLVTEGTEKVIRGGGTGWFPMQCRAAFRTIKYLPSNNDLSNGFRLVVQK